MTAASWKPARRARSVLPSVWPARTRTPPACARRPSMWPGRTRSPACVRGSTATRMVRQRSKAEVPVSMPVRASNLTVKAVPMRLVLTDVCGSRCRRSHISLDMARQRMPRPWREHEVDGFRRRLLGGDDEVALVLAVFVIDEDDHAALAQLVDSLLDGTEALFVRLHDLLPASTFERAELTYCP